MALHPIPRSSVSTPLSSSAPTTRGASGAVRRARRTTAGLALALALTACSVTDPDAAVSGNDQTCERPTEKVIGFDFPLSTLTIYEPLVAAFQAAAEERGYEGVVTANNMDLEQQTNDLNRWVTQGVQAFTTYPLEPTTLRPIASSAAAACVGFVTYGAAVEGEDAAVRFPWELNGEMQGEAAVAWAAERDEDLQVLVLSNDDIAAGAGRHEGLLSTFPGDATNVEIVSDQTAGDQQAGERVTSTVLQANPGLDMVLAYNDDVALGARQAFLNAGYDEDDPDVYISGMDGSAQALEIIRGGDILRASVGFSARDVITAIVDITIAVAEQREVDTEPVQPYLLSLDDPARVDEFLSYVQVG